MIHGPRRPLGDVLEISRERIEPTESPRKSFNYVGLESIESHTGSLLSYHPTLGVEIKSTKNVFQRGEILYGKLRPYLNKVHLAREDGICSTDIYVLRPRQQLIHPSYVAHYLRSRPVLDIVSNAMAGANLPRISPKSLLGIPIPVPPLPEQERVVNLLDEADELRKLRARADRRTTELIPALFHEMFGDGESKYFLNVKLGEITEIKSGAGFPLDKQGRLDQPIPFFKVGDMNTQGNEWAMLIFQHTISEATRRELGATLLPANSIVFPKVGAAIGTNKKRVISRPSCVDNNVMAIIPGDRITPEFLLAMLKAKNLTDFASNSNPPSIRKTTVESWEIMLPPVSLQKEFANRVNETRKLEADQAASRLRLEALFQSLLHRAFNEEL